MSSNGQGEGMGEGEGEGLIASRSEFHAALRWGFEQAAAAGSREIWLVDESFADWPLGDLAVVDQLQQWAASTRRLTLIARSFDEVERRHARWVAWRRPWSHIVSSRANTELEAGAIPTLMLATDTMTVRMSDVERYRGRAREKCLNRSDAAKRLRLFCNGHTKPLR